MLEELSRQVFRAALPSEWVVRPVDDDYGIDREVEIFKDGQATSFTFKVQLKASERLAASGPSRRVTTDQLRYWREFDVPVLIVYFVASTGELYGRWAHGVGLDEPIDADAATTTVRFRPRDRLQGAGDRLASEVVIVRNLRAGRVPSPLPVVLSVHASMDATSQAEVVLAVRSLLRALDARALIDVSGPDVGGALRGQSVDISLSREGANAILSATLPAELASIRAAVAVARYEADAKVAAADVLVALAFVLARMSVTTVAARILPGTARRSLLVRIPDVASDLAAVMHQHSLHDEAVAVAALLLASDSEEDRDTADVYYMSVLRDLKRLDGDGQRLLVDAMDQRAEREKRSSNPRRAGRAYYNLGQVESALDHTDRALALMEMALRFDPGYDERDYFYRERAGLRWTAGAYGQAAEDYVRALARGAGDADVRPLLADALMYAGQYGEARDALRSWNRTRSENDPLAALDQVVLDAVSEVVGMRTQNRRTASQVEVEVASQGADKIVALLRATDALDPRLWAALVHHGQEIVRGSIVIALMMLDDPLSWAMATVGAVAEAEDAGRPPYLGRDIVAVAAKLSDIEVYLEHVDEIVAEVEPPLDAALRDVVYGTLHDLSDAPAPLTTRFIVDPDDDA